MFEWEGSKISQQFKVQDGWGEAVCMTLMNLQSMDIVEHHTQLPLLKSQ
jgi:hypothetical protein